MSVVVVAIGRLVMHRFSLLLSLIAVVLLGVVAVRVQPGALAQEATPATEQMVGEEASVYRVSFTPRVELASPSDLEAFRVHVEPGAVLPVDPSPGVGIVLIDSGTLTVQVEAPLTVTHAAVMSEAMATAEATGDFSSRMEWVSAGEAITLDAGDAAYIPGDVPGEIRNEGREPATGVIFIVAPSQGMTDQATPLP
jgi:quercetin dioxygenase-like cupin family protein